MTIPAKFPPFNVGGCGHVLSWLLRKFENVSDKNYKIHKFK